MGYRLVGDAVSADCEPVAGPSKHEQERPRPANPAQRRPDYPWVVGIVQRYTGYQVRCTLLSFWRFISVNGVATLCRCTDAWASIAKQEIFEEHRQSNHEVVTMKPSASISLAERLGQTLGRVCCGYVRQERKVNGWLVGQGIPADGATVVLWGIKLVVLGVLLYSAFWLALLLVVLLTASLAFPQSKSQENIWPPNDEIRHGEAGFGLYSSGGHRLDPHEPNDPYDD
ncbi:hypothetical protein PcP3B5_25790 [Pseudomonas citronellolis]|nr:hypothetical protein PcP3B5_25790 [Pseudomonas citronellolis]